jgi:hypothetical protein
MADRDFRPWQERAGPPRDVKRERIAELEAALRSLQGYGLEFEDTQTVTIALKPWRDAMSVLPKP